MLWNAFTQMSAYQLDDKVFDTFFAKPYLCTDLIIEIISPTFYQNQLSAVGLLDLCLPEDHWNRPLLEELVIQIRKAA